MLLNKYKLVLTAVISFILFGITGCLSVPVNPPFTPNPITATPTSTHTPLPTTTPTIVPDPPTIPPTPFPEITLDSPSATSSPKYNYTLALTHQQADGNHIASGWGNISAAVPLSINLLGVPKWVVAAPLETGAIWVVILENGTVNAFSLIEGRVTPFLLSPEQIALGMPPALLVDKGVPSLVLPPTSDASPFSHPMPIADPKSLAYIENNGALVIWENGEQTRLAVDAIPDARILKDEQDRLLVYTGATTRYQHGALGDLIEASSITLIETKPTIQISKTINAPSGVVFEGIAPIWTDINQDGAREIIVTESNPTTGAQIVIYDQNGAIVSQGPSLGRGLRWRHQIAVADFLTTGASSLIEVITPHLGGIVQISNILDSNILPLATRPGLSSHQIGSRNLDMAVIGDFDGNGVIELVVPYQSMNKLAGIQFRGGQLVTVWERKLPSTISTNLFGLTMPNGNLILGAGLKNGTLQIWQP